MEQQPNEIKPECKTGGNYFFKICVVEALAVIFVILCVLVIKIFFKPQFEDLKKWYSQNLLTDTDTSEVLNPERTDTQNEI